jgi:hypothetical protein
MFTVGMTWKKGLSSGGGEVAFEVWGEKGKARAVKRHPNLPR